MKKKKIILIVALIVILFIIGLGFSLAYWIITKNQTNNNIVSTSCIKISLSNEQNDIQLQNQYPITDEEGMELTPYTFTITNQCTKKIRYDLSLELLGSASSAISQQSLKVAVDSDVPRILANCDNVDITYSGAYAAHLLKTDYLPASGSKNHQLRIWLDQDAPQSEMLKTLKSKITVVAGKDKYRLPFDYQEVEYIESTGTQYIDTGFKPSNTSGMYIKVSSNNTSDEVFTGCSYNNERWYVGTNLKTVYGGFNINDVQADRPLFTPGVPFEYKLNYKNNRLRMHNGVEFTSVGTIAPKNINSYIGAANFTNSPKYMKHGKFYFVIYTDNTEIVRNFIPCYRKSDSEVGMYDLVTNTFYENSGSGDFIAGDDV